MIKEWINEYAPKNHEDIHLALREIMQEIALAGLYRSGFFEKAAFYGGTALRILHGLDRFSEDLDFSLLKPDPSFQISDYLGAVIDEFASLGLTVTINRKQKSFNTKVESAFLKTDTVWNELILEKIIPSFQIQRPVHLKIKIEVDTIPPPDFVTEEKLLLKPFSFYVKCYTLSDLFAGKMHALLFRKWKQRVKGRDWYDMEWYIRKGVPLHLKHLQSRAIDSKDWAKQSFSEKDFKKLLEHKIQTISISSIMEDVRRFIKDDTGIAIWSDSYFLDLIGKMKFE
ncbi:MAG: nucleotidyl transferase AbiEii/AbiGii toxin family protein [Bacteroidota bacterium]|jgi:predicted nucleotidyltransferase component of viral defense system